MGAPLARGALEGLLKQEQLGPRPTSGASRRRAKPAARARPPAGGAATGFTFAGSGCTGSSGPRRGRAGASARRSGSRPPRRLLEPGGDVDGVPGDEGLGPRVARHHLAGVDPRPGLDAAVVVALELVVARRRPRAGSGATARRARPRAASECRRRRRLRRRPRRHLPPWRSRAEARTALEPAPAPPERLGVALADDAARSPAQRTVTVLRAARRRCGRRRDAGGIELRGPGAGWPRWSSRRAGARLEPEPSTSCWRVAW